MTHPAGPTQFKRNHRTCRSLMYRLGRVAANVVLGGVLLCGCALGRADWVPPAAPLVVAVATHVPAKTTVWVAPDIPAEVSEAISTRPGLTLSPDPSSSDCTVEAGPQHQIGLWIYALAAPFDTITDDVSGHAFVDKWRNHSAPFPVGRIQVAEADLAFLSSSLGVPDRQSLSIVSGEESLSDPWVSPDIWAIIPFDQLQPESKVISIDTANPVEKQFDPSQYTLSIPLSMQCEPQPSLPSSLGQVTNRDPVLLTTVILTGTTALVRGTAAYMETKGLTYPDTDVRDVLREADFLHVSNEAAYSPDCPLPWLNPDEERLRFCSAPKYNALLEDIGTDIVELTGDHLADWRPEAITYTLDLYRSLGWRYYGGGYNLEDGRKALLIEHNGNKLAFLGCNAKAPGYATATASTPGAVHCDFDDLTARIQAVKAEGYIPIVSFQHIEYESYGISPALQPDFRRVADAGAQIVSGSQGHQPQAIEFYNGAFLHYGLGNLFFDQYDQGLPTRQAFIDRYTFYGGKYISTQLLTTMFTDLAHPRWMTATERDNLLKTIFAVSVWQ
jgi:hypothetical protein